MSIKIYIKKTSQFIGSLLFFLNFPRIERYKQWLIIQFYTGFKKRCFKTFGDSMIHPCVTRIVGGKYIKIGSHTELSRGLTITAFDRHNTQKFTPFISIGNYCSIGEYAHITACGSILIGNGVLTGKHILITDNSHGYLDSIQDLELIPQKRNLSIKGNIIVEDNVWIGSNVTILGNVTIGRGSVVAANSVVTKDVPPYCIVAGVPSRIVKQINK